MSSYHPIPYQEPGSKYFPQWQATRSGSVTHMSPFNCCNEQIQSIAVFTQVHHLSHVQQFLDACDADALIKIEEVKTTQGFAWVAPFLLSDVDRSFLFVCRLHVFCRLPPLFTSTRPPTTFPQLPHNFTQRKTYTPHNTSSTAATMGTHYGSAELKDIGARSADRLPPASAALGMFEYELHRAAHDESLFNNAMIQAAKTAKEASKQQSRLDSLEDKVKACASHHNNERTVSISGSMHMILTCLLVDHFTSTHSTLSPSSPTHCHEPS